MTESETDKPERNELTRRRLLKGGIAAGVAGATLSTGAAALIEKAAAALPDRMPPSATSSTWCS